MRPLAFAAAILSLGLPAAGSAQTPMTAEEFEAFTIGNRFFFDAGGVPYGFEQYLGGRRVLWAFLAGQEDDGLLECTAGHWYAEGPRICFEYDDIETPQCWIFYDVGGQLLAEFQSDPPRMTVYQARPADDGPRCLGPEVGS